jgi:predicted CXXCH cytochrome family protein
LLGAICASLALASLLILTPGTGRLQTEEAPERIDPEASCLSGGCHTRFGEYEFPHWEDIVDECRDCHIAEGDAHEFEMDEEPDLCLECHEAVDQEEVLHEAVEDGCSDCHDPHGSYVGALLTASSERELCFECHDEDIVAESYKHGPVDSGECTGCHNPHSAPHSNLLRAQGRELCGLCHDELVEELDSVENIHDPAEDDCMDCHNPHSGPYANMLFAEGRALCDECHDDVVEMAEEAEVDHEPVTGESECITCHSPHGSDNDFNLKEPQVTLCLDCHDGSVKSGDETLADIKSWLNQNERWHEPIAEEGCSACHQPHGSDNFRLLKESFPSRFYAGFSLDEYGLCFSCHDAPLVTEERTQTATGFRDGDRNLHFLHVNREKKGRTCRACHEVHASSDSRLVRQRVLFGKWMMPIDFRSSETGGSCEPGCHASRSYDREKR